MAVAMVLLGRVLALAGVVAGCGMAPAPAGVSIHFLDVGQGDAVLIRSPEGHSVLVDAGPGRQIVPMLHELGVTSIDLLLLTHNHADHIGGAEAVLREMPVRYFMDNGVPHTTMTYRALLEALLEADVPLLDPERRSIRLGSVVLEVLPPIGDPSLGQNANSIGVVAILGHFRAFLPGDAEPVTWRHWIDYHPELFQPVQAYKSSHHGSRLGDTAEALALLSPSYTIISASASNQYGHPARETVSLLAASGARVLTTASEGTILVRGHPDGRVDVMSGRGRLSAQGPRTGTGSSGWAPVDVRAPLGRSGSLIDRESQHRRMSRGEEAHAP